MTSQGPTGGERARPRLSVVVLVTAGEREDLERCLASVEAHRALGGQELIVVDNAAGDGSAEMVAARHPTAIVVRHHRNLGVAVGRNAGLAVARGRLIAMLDSDVIVQPGALEALCAYLEENPDTALVGPRIEYPDGTLQASARRVPTLAALLANRSTGVRWMRDLAARRRHLMIGELGDRTLEVDYLLGATMVFRSELAAQAGGFDTRMTIGGYGFDDADWGLSARERGWKVVYLPSARVTHVYRRRLAGRPLAPGNAGMAISYVLFRLKHVGRRAGGHAAPARRTLLSRLGAPAARAAVAVARLSGQRAGAALVYHRVAGLTGDPERELVPPHGADLFRGQLRHLRRVYRVVPASALPEAVASRRRGQRFPVAVTFDDDLSSHAAFALPLLRQEGLTATFFLGGASLDGPHAHWWERLQAVADAGRAAEVAEVARSAPVTERPWSLHELAVHIEAMPAERRTLVDRALVAIADPAPPGAGLRRDDVEALARAGMEIGFHTRRHSLLTGVPDAELARLLTEGRAELEAVAGRRLTAFCYPHGKASAREAAAAREAGFATGYTTRGGAVLADSDPMLLGRIEPSFVSVGHFAARLAATLLLPALVRSSD